MNKRGLKHLRKYAHAGRRVTPLGRGPEGKMPIHENWQETPYVRDIEKREKQFKGALWGFVLDATDLIVDIDKRNGGLKSLKRFKKNTGLDLVKKCKFIVRTGSGNSFHLYFTKPGDIPTRESLKDSDGKPYKGIEFKTVGRQVVGPGSINKKTKKEYTVEKGESIDDVTEAPAELVELLFRERAEIIQKEAVYDDSKANKKSFARRCKDAEPAIEGEGGSNTTYKLFCLGRDMGLSPDKAVSIVLKFFNPRCQPEWSDDELIDLCNNAYRYAQNSVGAKHASNDFKDMPETVELSEEEALEQENDIENEAYNFDEWCYIIGLKRFANTHTKAMYDKEQFDDIYGKQFRKIKGSKFAIGYSNMQRVYLPTYAPGKKTFVTEDNQEKLNTWLPPLIFPEKGRIKPFLNFMKYLIPDDRERGIVLDFLAHMVRFPGERSNSALIIKGKPGIGKSLFGRLLEQMLGRENVARPTNTQMHEQYTGYMKNAQCVIIEELMAGGRLQLFNKMKDMITEPRISIREMHMNAYLITNRASFIAFTNHADAIVIPRDDRRFIIIFSPAVPRDKDYYDGLVDYIENNASAVMHYLIEEHEMSGEYSLKGVAPMTSAKEHMQLATRHPVEHTLGDWFDDAQFPLHGRIADANAVMDLLKAAGHRHINMLSVCDHLETMGYKDLGRVRLTSGERRRLWLIRNIDMFDGLSHGKIVSLYEKQERDADNSDAKNYFANK